MLASFVFGFLLYCQSVPNLSLGTHHLYLALSRDLVGLKDQPYTISDSKLHSLSYALHLLKNKQHIAGLLAIHQNMTCLDGT